MTFRPPRPFARASPAARRKVAEADEALLRGGDRVGGQVRAE
ncbi:hypothetical protein AB0H92_35290 [Streptomyces phaeochromogenes]